MQASRKNPSKNASTSAKQPPDSAADSFQQCAWIASEANGVIRAHWKQWRHTEGWICRHLSNIDKVLRLRRAIETELPNVAHDADNPHRNPVIGRSEQNRLSKRIHASEITACQRLVDHDDRSLPRSVLLT